MKKLLLMTLLSCIFLQARADTWTDPNGVTWTYTINGMDATITKSSKTEGSLEIPSSIFFYSVTSIGSYAFRNCSGLTSVTIPSSVTSIGSYAFSGCSGLTSVTIPEGVTIIGYATFYSCSGLTSVTIPSSVTIIGPSAFEGCSGLTSVTIPSSVTGIGQNAFNKCSGLTSVTIPEGVTSIGNAAFYNCSGLTSVTIPEGVTSIGDAAFYNCSGLTSVTINSNAIMSKAYGSYSNGSYSTYSNLGTIFGTQVENYIIGEGVTSIGERAFEYCSGLTSVTIPSSVTSIGNSTFHSCSGLTSVTIPESVTSIGNYAFSGCFGLTSVTILEGVTSIGNSTFHSCSGLTSVTIPESVTSIGKDAFYQCTGLTKVIVPDIAAWCRISFGNNTANPLCYANNIYSDENTEITDLIIPEGVTSIGFSAFFGCSSLTSVTIPESVTSIGDYAFYDCRALRSITNFSERPQECSNSIFLISSSVYDPTYDRDYDVYYYAKLHVPPGMKYTYYFGDYPWCLFHGAWHPQYGYYGYDHIYDDAVNGIEPVTTAPDEVAVTGIYDTNGKALPAMRPGINIIRYSDGTTKKVVLK